MPIANARDAVEVGQRLDDILDEEDAENRIGNIRTLLIETLDWQYADGLIPLHSARNGDLPSDARLIASRDGTSVVYIPLTNADTDRITATAVNAAARSLRDTLSDDLLLLLTNRSADQFHIIRPDLTHARPRLQRMVARRGEHHRTVVQQLANMWDDYGRNGKTVHEAIGRAFSVEPVTADFFREYRRIFADAKDGIRGFANEREQHLFTQTLFNRLMFVYFISRKGWLNFGGDTDYLNALWQDYNNRKTSDSNFYWDRLRLLFFAGLNNAKSEDLTEYPDSRRLIGKVPFLNGGLFEETAVDVRSDIYVPDAVVLPLLRNLFDRFNFTVTESTPYDTEVAVDPEMLGKVFEELVNERNESGAYYTPRPVVSFMCREALKGYIASRHPELDAYSISGFVDDGRGDALPRSVKTSVATSLDEVTTVDPACGSGAYLLGMLQELIVLRDALFNESGEADPRDEYQRKLHIISRNLYGADIDNFAVNIAMLRLWLSLVIEYEGEKPDPLPNLDFKIVCGDSLLAPDPSPQNYGDLFGDFIRQFDLGRLKAEHMRTTEQAEKDRLKAEIEDARQQIREMLGDAAGDDILDWRVEFAEVMGGGGFDIVVANPPYVQLQRDSSRLAKLYKDVGYATYFRGGDVYHLFYERGCQILRPSVGLLAYITSNSWLKAEYGRRLREYLSERHSPISLLGMGKDVFDSAIVDSSVLLLRNGRESEATRIVDAVDVDRIRASEFPPLRELWGNVHLDGGETWSILSSAEQSAVEKIQSIGTNLKDWDVKIQTGIKTGFNKAFIINDVIREDLLGKDPHSAEIIKPVLRGRDVQSYSARWARSWLIDTHNGFEGVPAVNIDEYPAVKSYLKRFISQLTKRRDKGITPYNLRNCAYHSDFSSENILWRRVATKGMFAYVAEEMYCINAVNMIVGDSLKYLCAVLNSNLITWYAQQILPTSGTGTFHWEKAYVERMPVPQLSIVEQQPFIALVDEILAAKSADPQADTSELEEEIDWLVYDLYDLTDGEVSTIADALWDGEVSEEEEDTALVRAIEEGLKSERADIEEAKSILRERHEARN